MSATTVTRRDLFRRLGQPDVEPLSHVLRPPGAVQPSEFTDLCTRCVDCRQACPEHVIVKGDGGFPELSFDHDGCTLCGKCVEACAFNALQPFDPPYQLGRLELSETCLPQNGVSCQSCKDACEARAIEFKYTQSIPTPVITEQCYGCGACVSVCPVNALSVLPDSVPLQRESLR